MTTTKKNTTVKKTTSAKKPAAKKKATPKKTVAEQPPMLKLLKNDKYLQPYAQAIEGRHQHALDKINELTDKGKTTLVDFASGHLYYGLHRQADGSWVIREWAQMPPRFS